MTEQYRETGISKPSLDEPATLKTYGEAVKVHTECGIDIFFSPWKQEFSAALRGGDGRSEIRSGDFQVIVDRIRKRALRTPVNVHLVHRAYLRDAEKGTTPPFRVIPAQVVEYHQGRVEPFMVQYVDEENRIRHTKMDRDIYLFTPEQIQDLTRIATEMMHEEADHRRVLATLDEQQAAILTAARQANVVTVKRIQETERQIVEHGNEPAANT